MSENEKQTSRERLKDITDSIEKGIQELFQSDKYAQYLRTMSRFHRYSVNNTLLIYMQKPDATLIAGFSKWRNQFQRNVMKGEKGIKIIAPTPYKKKVEEQKLDPDTRQPMLDAQGNVIMDEKEVIIPMFKPVTVFDVSQTDGKPLPQLASDLTGNVQNYDAFIEALRRSSPVPIDFKPLQPSIDGYFSPASQSITIREGMSEIQTVSAVVHEIAHSKLHNPALAEDNSQWKVVMVSPGGVKRDLATAFATEEAARQFAEENEWRYVDENQFEWALEVEETLPDTKIAERSRRTQEVEAESVSFAVCAYYGIATGENSFGYIASWSRDKDLQELRDSLETINKSASELISDIDSHYAEIMKEREAALTERQASNHDDLPDPSVSIESMRAYGYTDDKMLPLSRERALELMEHDVRVYMLFEDNTEAAADTPETVRLFSGLFGVERTEWEQIRSEIPPMDIALVRQKQETAFQASTVDSYAIYQLRNIDENADIRFMGSEWLQKQGLEPDRNNYELVYTGMLAPEGSVTDKLDNLYETFNINRPVDFRGHSLSVSDVVALNQQGEISYHYVDNIGFRELAFFGKDNYLKPTELQTEDDYGMIDGIINNGTRQADVPGKKLPVREHEKQARPSVLAKLRAYQEAEKLTKAKHRRAERNEIV